MHRTKAFGVAAALVSATIAAMVLTGGASASSWHTYKGDMFAGHAYGIQVPAGADSVEFGFDGAEAGSASLGVYTPSGDKAGFYKLAPTLTTASVANPDAGRFVVYVYDITEGALSVRVASENEPAKLEIETIALAREETTIGTFEQGKLDQVVTADLKKEAVFVTLLYEGSSKDLDATVSSTEGAVVTITDESATAFSPGVWTSLKGERAFDAAHLAGTTYTVELHAAQFEGTMVLTTLSVDFALPQGPLPHAHAPATPSAPAHPRMPAERPSFDASAAHFALEEGVPVAFVVQGGTLVLADPAALDEDEDGDASYGDECAPLHGVVAIYGPDDSLVGLVELSHDAPTATLALEMRGEYVAYARHVEGDVILAMIEGQRTAPTLRTLAIAEEVFDFSASSFLVESSAPQEFEVTHTPLDLALWADGLGAISTIEVANEHGTVARVDAIASAPGAGFLQWTSVDAASFARGAHTLALNGVYEGNVQLVSTHYVRASDAGAAVVVEPEEPARPGAPPTPPTPPTPPDLVSLVAGLLGQ